MPSTSICGQLQALTEQTELFATKLQASSHFKNMQLRTIDILGTRLSEAVARIANVIREEMKR